MILKYYGDISRNVYVADDDGYKGINWVMVYTHDNGKDIIRTNDITIVDVAAGQNCLLFVDINGFVHRQRCRDGKPETARTTPRISRVQPILMQAVSQRIKVVQIVSGSYHVLAFNDKYQVYSWGNNDRGQCGLNKVKANVQIPELIQDFSEYNISEIKAEIDNSYAKSDDGKHWIWGDNSFGQCSLESKDTNKRGHTAEQMDNIKYASFGIDDIFYEQIKTSIDQVFLGYSAVYITAYIFT